MKFSTMSMRPMPKVPAARGPEGEIAAGPADDELELDADDLELEVDDATAGLKAKPPERPGFGDDDDDEGGTEVVKVDELKKKARKNSSKRKPKTKRKRK